jgi:hypothetical protein
MAARSTLPQAAHLVDREAGDPPLEHLPGSASGRVEVVVGRGLGAGCGMLFDPALANSRRTGYKSNRALLCGRVMRLGRRREWLLRLRLPR